MNPQDAGYHRYGGRGITVCDRWLDFNNFVADMGQPPAGCSIDRIDNDGPYCPDNCRWATKHQQERNKSTNRWITANGQRLIQKDWALLTGISDDTISDRLADGWSEQDAVTIPEGRRARGERVNTAKFTPDIVRSIRSERGEGKTLEALSEKYDSSIQSIWKVCQRKSWAHVS